MVYRLLILVLFGCGFCLPAGAQQPPVKPVTTSADTLRDTLKPTLPDTLIVLPFHFLPFDSISFAPPDTVKPKPADTLTAHADTLHPDSLASRSDTLHRDSLADRADTLHRDSLALARDSLRRRDSIRQANYVPDAVTLRRQIDSANAASSLAQTNTIDSLKLRLDAALAAANNRPRTNGPPGLPGRPNNPNATNANQPPTGTMSLPGSPPTTSGIASTTPGRKGAGPALRNTPVTFSNFHQKVIPVHGGSTNLDTLSIIPGSLSIRGVDTGAYQLDWVNGSISWIHPPAQDTVTVFYRSFPYKLNAVGRRFNYDSIINYFLVRPYDPRRSGNSSEDNFFNFGNISYNGSFGRSISFGNSQDAVVTSNLNLQISGYLADSIRIEAAITDNNIPIQPDGTTADLNEFDKIYLQFSRKNWALTMGDIDLRQNQNYFLSFYKRLQGASFETTEKLSSHVTNKLLTSAAIAKGKFTRNIFQGQEGNQGPYQLHGANNELSLSSWPERKKSISTVS